MAPFRFYSWCRPGTNRDGGFLPYRTGGRSWRASALARGVIVIGGGVSWSGDRLFERLRRETPRRTINQFACDTPIVPAALGADVGVIGGAAPLL